MSLLDFYIFVVDSRDVNFFQSTTSYHSCGFGFFFLFFFCLKDQHPRLFPADSYRSVLSEHHLIY